jgi:hypothetical protein
VSAPLGLAAALACAVGVAHSVLGERYILLRLLRRSDLPRLFGGEWFTRRTLRLAWHLTSIAWWGFGAQLLLAAAGAGTAAMLHALAGTFLASALLTLGLTRGRHLAWVVFLAIALLAWLAA